MKKSYNKLSALLLLSVVLLLISCSSTLQTIQTGSVLDIEKKYVVYNETVVQEGELIWRKISLFQKPQNNEVLLSGFTVVNRLFNGIGFPLVNQYYTTAKLYYKKQKIRVRFTYDYQETYNDMDDDDDFNPKRGNFSNIKTKKLPKKYKFEIIDPVRLISIGYPLENTLVTQEDLPLILTGFSIDEKPFKLVLTKMPDKASVSIRSLIRYQEQEALIIDYNCNVCASFTTDNYTIYDQPNVSPEELIVPIGVYSGLFLLLNEY